MIEEKLNITENTINADGVSRQVDLLGYNFLADKGTLIKRGFNSYEIDIIKEAWAFYTGKNTLTEALMLFAIDLEEKIDKHPHPELVEELQRDIEKMIVKIEYLDYKEPKKL